LIQLIEGQPVANNNSTYLKQIYFQCGAIPYWKPNVPGEQYVEHKLCLYENTEEIRVVWSENSNGEVRFEDLGDHLKNEVLSLLGIQNDGSTFSNWLLIITYGLEPECSQDTLKRITSFPETPLAQDEPTNGILFRDSSNCLLCWSQKGYHWNNAWIRPTIRVKDGLPY
jgi:hypothetical protein